MANKITYGLDQLYYAKVSTWTDGVPTYATPVAIPGAVSITFSNEGDITKFKADNIDYWVGEANNGYSGSFEVADLPQLFYTDILGAKSDSNVVIYEDQESQSSHFALLFQFQGDEKAVRHVLYNCVAKRPDIASSTKGDSIEPNTMTVDIEASSAKLTVKTGVNKMVVKAFATSAANTTAYNGWYSTVYVPVET